MLPDKKEYIGVLCKRLYKRAWINVNNIVLISKRDFQEDKIDIIHRYSDDDVRVLLQMKEITPTFALHQEDNDDMFSNHNISTDKKVEVEDIVDPEENELIDIDISTI